MRAARSEDEEEGDGAGAGAGAGEFRIFELEEKIDCDNRASNDRSLRESTLGAEFRLSFLNEGAGEDTAE